MRELLAYSQGAVVEEKLALRIRANSDWDIYLPVAWYSEDGTQDCEYAWKVSIDGGEETTYKGVGSSNGAIRVGYGLNPLSVHTVIVKPNVEWYGWLRAFGYKGTTIGSSLINIISDKSYKGYALSDLNSGDYYKAYQYYGCVNLINTDEELLPDTLEVIGDYYRYYEYAGCSKLVSNAEEKILKTVKVIGNYYRAYQYENCESINKINMRAINWASVWNNYRYNQYSWISSDKKPANIYIEGWIEEGGNWWLQDSRVKNIYVYKDLVSDYQTKLSGITGSKIQKNDEWDSYEYEFIEYIGLADSSGEIRVPVAWFSTSFTQDCDYDWMVSIDGGEAVEITGTGGQTYVSLGSDLIEGSEHRVVIKPKTIGWWWWRAFWFLSSGAQWYIKEIIHDSYKCYASGRVDTWAHYKHGVFAGCTNLINSYEKLPTSVETVGDYYMKECYAWCTGLKSAFWEVMHSGVEIGEDYRYHEYTGCTSLEVHQWIAGYTGIEYPTNYKYEYLSGAWNDAEIYITRYEALAGGLTNSMWLADNKVDKVYCYIDDIYKYKDNSNWSNISDNKFDVYYYNYVCLPTVDISKYTKLVGTYNIPIRWATYDYSYSLWMWNFYHRWIQQYWKGTYDVRIPWDRYTKASWKVYWLISRLWWKIEDNTGIDRWNSYDIAISWGQTDWNVKAVYVDYKGNAIYSYFSEWGWGSPYRHLGGRGNIVVNAWFTGWETHISASRDGRWVFWDNKQYYSSTKWGWLTEYKSYIGSYTDMHFSDDGKTVYLSSNFGKITQYNLSSPRDLTTLVSTGNELNISWSWGLSKDQKYLFVFDGQLKVYEYEE